MSMCTRSTSSSEVRHVGWIVHPPAESYPEYSVSRDFNWRISGKMRALDTTQLSTCQYIRAIAMYSEESRRRVLSPEAWGLRDLEKISSPYPRTSFSPYKESRHCVSCCIRPQEQVDENVIFQRAVFFQRYFDLTFANACIFRNADRVKKGSLSYKLGWRESFIVRRADIDKHDLVPVLGQGAFAPSSQERSIYLQRLFK